MVPLLLIPLLARPGANCYALALLGRLACVDTRLRDAAREQLAARRAAQQADAPRAAELERAMVKRLVRKQNASEQDEYEPMLSAEETDAPGGGPSCTRRAPSSCAASRRRR
jgi:hypothetical protein